MSGIDECLPIDGPLTQKYGLLAHLLDHVERALQLRAFSSQDDLEIYVSLADVFHGAFDGKPVFCLFRRKAQVSFDTGQGFVPPFDLPLTVAAPERPLGTHVFTAMALTENGAAMRWTVVSIPSSYPHQADHARTRAKKTPHDRREPLVAGSTPQAASTAAEALDRTTLPPEATEQISALLSPGASLILSDDALSDETGVDTEFVVLTR